MTNIRRSTAVIPSIGELAQFVFDFKDRGYIQQIVFKFENGYGASVLRGDILHMNHEGLFEIGVVKFDGDDFELNHETPITNDVIAWQTGEDVVDVLKQIRALPPHTNVIDAAPLLP